METAESRALHSDVKLNKAGVMFSFISPVIALTVCVMVPGKIGGILGDSLDLLGILATVSSSLCVEEKTGTEV